MNAAARPSDVWLRRAGAVLVIGSLAFAFRELGKSLLKEQLTPHFGWLALGALGFAAAYLCTSWGFRRLLARGADRPVPALACREIYFRSLLARYLPGKVGVPAVRIPAADAFGVSRAFMASSVLIEALAWIGSGALLGLSASFLAKLDRLETLLRYPWLTGFVVLCNALVLLALCTLDASRWPNRLLQVLRMPPRSGALVPYELVLANASFWLTNALATVCVAASLGVGLRHAPIVATAATLVPVAGFLVVVAPAGLGVREALFTLLLAPELGSGKALAISLFARAASLVMEIVLWLVTRGLVSARSRAEQPTSGSSAGS
jgi:uncharacterized membrane protein YbhN (UPF0104 family)